MKQILKKIEDQDIKFKYYPLPTRPSIFFLIIFNLVIFFFIFLLFHHPTTVKALTWVASNEDSCGLIYQSLAENPTCSVFSTDASNQCVNPQGNPTNPNINSETLKISLSSTNGAAHQITYFAGNAFCTKGYLTTSDNVCSCSDNGIYQTQTLTVPAKGQTSLTISRSPTLGSYCGSYQFDFSILSVDGNTNCNTGNTTNHIGASLICETGITCTAAPPTYTITGNVFDDYNKNGLIDNGESNYTGGITLQSSGGKITTAADGTYTITGLTAGSYTAFYTSLPSTYSMTSPLNGPPPSYTVTVGTNCSTNGALGSSCADGNISNLNFGISNVHPWWQVSCLDARESPLVDTLPAGASAFITNASCINAPGLPFPGNVDGSYGQGQISSTNQSAGGALYPEVYSPNTSTLSTSYTALISKAQSANLSEINLSSVCNLSNCTLPANLSHGIYIANGNVILNPYTFPANQNYVLLIQGNLTINGNINIPVGSTALFSTTGNIIVSSAVGSAPTVATANLSGWYIAGQSFINNSQGNCNDLRLNIAGAVVVNAQNGGGTLQNNRDLCGNDLNDPTISFTPRADMILNAPLFIKQEQTLSQEVQP